jgi:hypothetical protein
MPQSATDRIQTVLAIKMLSYTAVQVLTTGEESSYIVYKSKCTCALHKQVHEHDKCYN